MASSFLLFFVSCALLFAAGLAAGSSARGEELAALLRHAPSPVKGVVHPEDAALLLNVSSRWKKAKDMFGNYLLVDKLNLLGTWKVTSPCSKWYGVTCDSATQRVTGIKLPGLNRGERAVFSISGHCPAALGFLPDLGTLILARNGFSGKVPEYWGRLRKLAHLDLSSNGWATDTMGLGKYFRQTPYPQVLGNLTGLTYLNLAKSGLGDSPLPKGLKQLSRLQWLALTSEWGGSSARTCFAKSDSQTLASFTRLETLSLRDCGLYLSDLKAFSRLRRLRNLDLWHNPLGSLNKNSWLGSLKGLVTLDLTPGNGGDTPVPLFGTIPAWLGGLTKLTGLDLSNNLLSGPIPASLFQPGWALNLADNQLSGPLPPSALDLIAQRLAAAAKGSTVRGSLDLSGNYLTGPCYSSIVASLKCPAETKKECSKRVTQDLAGLAGNCLQQCSKVPIGSPPNQDVHDNNTFIDEAPSCSAFCGADKPSGPCNGHGICSGDYLRTDGARCTCNKGFLAPAKKPGTCVPAP